MAKNHDPDAPVLTEDLLTLIQRQLAEQPQDAASIAAKDARAAKAARELEEKRKTPRMSIPENVQKLEAAAADFAATLESKRYTTDPRSPKLDDKTKAVLVKHFKGLVAAMDNQNHPYPEAPMTEDVIGALLDDLKAVPAIAQHGEKEALLIARGLIIHLVPPAIRTAKDVGVSMPYVSKKTFMPEIFSGPGANR